MNRYIVLENKIINLPNSCYSISLVNLKLPYTGYRLGKPRIEFINSGLTDEKLCWYYQNCKGFIFPGEEDFGISAKESI